MQNLSNDGIKKLVDCKPKLTLQVIEIFQSEESLSVIQNFYHLYTRITVSDGILKQKVCMKETD